MVENNKIIHKNVKAIYCGHRSRKIAMVTFRMVHFPMHDTKSLLLATHDQWLTLSLYQG